MRLLPTITPETKTKYSDLSGAIEIDWEGRVSNLVMLCSAHGIDMQKYYLIGFGFVSVTEDAIRCKALLIDSDRYGDSFEALEQTISEIDEIDAVQKTFDITHSELEKYIKHINAMLFTRLGREIKTITITSDETIEKHTTEFDEFPLY